MKETEVECEGGRGKVGKRGKQSVREGEVECEREGECEEGRRRMQRKAGQGRARQVGEWEVWQLPRGDNGSL